ncbi:MAG: FeoA domain-containing protein [Desulfobacterales bacterium]|nr:FeoA domain-containing protein [Desulfobacterales bacterium]
MPEATLKILNRNGSGSVMVAVKNSKLAVGRRIAKKIVVE